MFTTLHFYGTASAVTYRILGKDMWEMTYKKLCICTFF